MVMSVLIQSCQTLLFIHCILIVFYALLGRNVCSMRKFLWKGHHEPQFFYYCNKYLQCKDANNYFLKNGSQFFIYNSLVSMLIHPCWLHNHKWGQKWLLTCMIPWAGTFWDNACKQLHYTVFVHVARHCSLFSNLVEEVLEISCLNSSEFWSLQPVHHVAISFSFPWSSLYWSQFLSFTCP